MGGQFRRHLSRERIGYRLLWHDRAGYVVAVFGWWAGTARRPSKHRSSRQAPQDGQLVYYLRQREAPASPEDTAARLGAS
jgi:hypothetical protein